MGFLEAYRFGEELAKGQMDKMEKDFRRTIRKKSDAEIQQLAQSMTSPRLLDALYDEMSRRGL